MTLLFGQRVRFRFRHMVRCGVGFCDGKGLLRLVRLRPEHAFTEACNTLVGDAEGSGEVGGSVPIASAAKLLNPDASAAAPLAPNVAISTPDVMLCAATNSQRTITVTQKAANFGATFPLPLSRRLKYAESTIRSIRRTPAAALSTPTWLQTSRSCAIPA
jgi:hypothetical protein